MVNEIETFLVSCVCHCISGAFMKKRGPELWEHSGELVLG